MMNAATKTQWYLGTVYRIPTRHSRPELIAIEATDQKQAGVRIRKLYGETHAAACGQAIEECLDGSVASDTDDLTNRIKYPLPTAL